MWTCLLQEQMQNYCCTCLQLQIPWQGNKMLFSSLGVISVPTCFPLHSSQTSIIKCDAFNKFLLYPSCSSLASVLFASRPSLASEGVDLQISWLFWWKNLLNFPCCGICWSTLTSGSFIEVWRRCNFTCGNYQVSRLQGWLF